MSSQGRGGRNVSGSRPAARGTRRPSSHSRGYASNREVDELSFILESTRLHSNPVRNSEWGNRGTRVPSRISATIPVVPHQTRSMVTEREIEEYMQQILETITPS